MITLFSFPKLSSLRWSDILSLLHSPSVFLPKISCHAHLMKQIGLLIPLVKFCDLLCSSEGACLDASGVSFLISSLLAALIFSWIIDLSFLRTSGEGPQVAFVKMFCMVETLDQDRWHFGSLYFIANSQCLITKHTRQPISSSSSSFFLTIILSFLPVQ